MRKPSLVLTAFAVALLCLILLPGTALASSSYRYFESYDVQINVLSNNVLQVTETIVSDYSRLAEKGHGILRYIPVKLRFALEDGSERRYVSLVDDVEVPGHQFKKYKEGDYVVLQIGDPSKYATGKVTYVIKYTFDIGDDGVEDYDFFTTM